MIQRMLAIWSLVPLPFLKPAWTSGSSRFTYCWSLAWRILRILRILLYQRVRWVQLCGSLSILWHCLFLGLEWKLNFSSPVATAEFSMFANIDRKSTVWTPVTCLNLVCRLLLEKKRYCAVVRAFFGIAFFGDWNENWPFPVLWPLLSFPNLLAYWVQHFHSIIFQDLE